MPAQMVLDDAVDRVRGLAERRQIRLEVSSPDKNLAVIGDRRQLVSALGNLVDNALKYTPEGGEVTLRDLGAASQKLVPLEDLAALLARKAASGA